MDGWLNDTVYVLGAGVNQAIKTFDRKPVVSPPLMTNFFKIARKVHVRFRDYDTILKALYDYIFKYWHKTKDDLENSEFSLEDCFSFIQLQLIDAQLELNIQCLQLY
jgi:hypothetical protein